MVLLFEMFSAFPKEFSQGQGDYLLVGFLKQILVGVFCGKAGLAGARGER